MNSFKVEGGVELSGDITPQGAKNEALQILCATLLTSEKVIIENVPEIIDVLRLIDLLKILGVKIEKISKNKYSFEAKNIDLAAIESDAYQSKAKGPISLDGNNFFIQCFSNSFISNNWKQYRND